MINPTVLLTELVEQLKAIPELSEVPVDSYNNQSVLVKTLEDAVASFGYATGVLVAYDSGEFPRAGETSGVRHVFQIGIIAQDASSAFELMTNIYNGVPIPPAGDGRARFVDLELPGCDPINDLTHSFSLDENGNQLWSIRFTATEKQ